MMRRDFLTSATAAVFIPAMGVAAEGPTAIALKYAEWQADHAHVNGPAVRGMHEDEYERLVAELTDLEDVIINMAATCPRDVIMQMIAYSNRGEIGLPGIDSTPSFWRTAETFLRGAA